MSAFSRWRRAPIVSIFAKPALSGPNEDLNIYPRRLLRDETGYRDSAVSLVAAPDAQNGYPA
jgi:pantothenate synthetase